jgi:serine/threonine-protein kinase
VVSVYEVGEADGRGFVAVAVIEGTALGARIKQERVLALADAAMVVVQVADALEAAHGRGVVHGYLRPSDILLGVDGRAHIAHFPVVRQDFVGKPVWAAPERLVGDVDARTDVYGLAEVLFYCLTARAPFPGGDLFAKFRRQRLALADFDVELPAVGAVISRALERDPADRYQSPEQFAQAIAGAA